MAVKEQDSEIAVVHGWFTEGDSILLRMKVQDKPRVSWLADLTSHITCPDVHKMESRTRGTLSLYCAIISDFCVTLVRICHWCSCKGKKGVSEQSELIPCIYYINSAELMKIPSLLLSVYSIQCTICQIINIIIHVYTYLQSKVISP